MPEESSAPTVSQAVTSTGGSNKVRKVALIVLAVVFLVIISEVGYLIFSKEDGLFPRKTEEAQIEQEPPVPTTPTALPSQLVSQTPKILNTDKARWFTDMLDDIKANNELDLLGEAFISFTATGVVTNAAPGEKEVNTVEYVYLIQIKSPGGNTASYWFTDREILNAQVSLTTNTGTSEISIMDIKPGDNVSIKEIINLLDASPHSEVVLEVRR